MNFPKFIFYCALITLLASCGGNNISYDKEKNEVIGEDGSIIRLKIDADTFTYNFYLIPLENSTRRLKLCDYNDGYRTYVNTKNGSEDVNYKFKFQPNKEYTIKNNSNGDASSCTIYLVTDSTAKVIQWRREGSTRTY